MKITVDKKFLKDLKKLRKNPQVVRRVDARVAEIGLIITDVVTIEEAVEVIPSIKKMKGYDFHYRVRVGDYRLGVFFDTEVEDDEAVLIMQRCLHRKDIYLYFPDE